MSGPDKRSLSFDIHHHPRLSEFNRLVYPVLSRRAGGISLGINLNPTKKCSFNCIYCQVDRTTDSKNLAVDLLQIESELDYWIKTLQESESDGNKTEIKDISIAGDGEPTLFHDLPLLLEKVIAIRTKHQLTTCKLVLFTNGSTINRPGLLKVFPTFYANHGEIWYKLDFWDEASYHQINRSSVPLSRVIDNLLIVGRQFPITLQSCVFSWGNLEFSEAAYQGYRDLIEDLLKKGVNIQSIQVYTVARKPADPSVKPWSDREMDRLYSFLKETLQVDLSLIYSGGKSSQ